MEIKRTANAGVLLKLDGVTILLDGVCGYVPPYLPTPQALRLALLNDPPQVVAFTHKHADHYDATFVSDYLHNTAGPILGPADIPLCSQKEIVADSIRIHPIPTRHIGKAEPAQHMSYILSGTHCVWFLGDASPLCFAHRDDLPWPDVMIAPYAYTTAGGWEITKQLAPKALVLLHLPDRSHDPFGLWDQVEMTVKDEHGVGIYIPAMGQTIRFAD